MKKIRFTKDGLEKLKKERSELKASRPAAVEDLKKARDMGDLSENGYYKAAKQKLSGIDYRLRTMDFQIKQAEVINNMIVTLQNGDKTVTYTIVGDLEANPSMGSISHKSPIGRAVEGRKKGEAIEILTPSGKIKYKILELTS